MDNKARAMKAEQTFCDRILKEGGGGSQDHFLSPDIFCFEVNIPRQGLLGMRSRKVPGSVSQAGILSDARQGFQRRYLVFL